MALRRSISDSKPFRLTSTFPCVHMICKEKPTSQRRTSRPDETDTKHHTRTSGDSLATVESPINVIWQTQQVGLNQHSRFEDHLYSLYQSGHVLRSLEHVHRRRDTRILYNDGEVEVDKGGVHGHIALKVTHHATVNKNLSRPDHNIR